MPSILSFSRSDLQNNIYYWIMQAQAPIMQAQAPIRAEKKRTIKHWALDDRPREKLIAKGPQFLSDSELLCVLIGNGTPKTNAMELARLLLKKHKNNLQLLGKSTVQDLVKLKIEGFGKAKASTIVAALELGRRRQAGLSPRRPTFKDSKAAAGYLLPQLAYYPYEVFGVLYLDQAGKLKHFGILSQGGITATTVDPRLIFKKALQEEAVSIIISHNHPSGSLQPSRADELLTTKINEGAKLLDIKLLDHIIVGDQGYFSFANEGLLP
jgi:DNA repair protein RadC